MLISRAEGHVLILIDLAENLGEFFFLVTSQIGRFSSCPLVENLFFGSPYSILILAKIEEIS